MGEDFVETLLEKLSDQEEKVAYFQACSPSDLVFSFPLVACVSVAPSVRVGPVGEIFPLVHLSSYHAAAAL